MRTYISTLVLLIFLNSYSQVEFDKYFTGERLRFEYTITDSLAHNYVGETDLIGEAAWSGPRTTLIDPFGYGEMKLELYDSATGTLIYSYGYSTLYNEWQSVNSETRMVKSFRESLVMPFPKNTAFLKISERGANMQFAELLVEKIIPDEIPIVQTAELLNHKMRVIIDNGLPEKKLDIVFLSYAYSFSEQEKFFDDARLFAQSFSRWEPYSSRLNEMNVRALFVPNSLRRVHAEADSCSKETGFQTSFSALGIDRYVMSSDIAAIRSMLASVHYDQICIIVDTNEYGGGGIYNYLTVFAAGNPSSEFLFQHEFAHGFAALADEYFGSEVTYKNLFSSELEPYQPNITTLADFDSKWKHLVHDTVPVPTPNSRQYSSVVGVFEGAAYNAEGIYRPYNTCSMKSGLAEGFCPVCKLALEKMLNYYSGK